MSTRLFSLGLRLRDGLQAAVAAALLLGALSEPAVRAAEYEIRLLPAVPGAFSTYGTGLNDVGIVVGQTLVGSPLMLQAWVWTDESGMEVLPPPPGLSDYRAIDVNNAGVITGDGGFDWGEAWRFAGGAYEMLGMLPGDPMSTAAGINEAGEVTGTSKHPSQTQPRNSYYAPLGSAMFQVLADSYATYLNEAGQVVGYAISNVAYRYTPGSGVEFLPPLGGRVLSWAWSINDAGAVVGEAAQANGNGHVPFLFTDAGGMQEIGSFGGSSGAADINNRGSVVGNFDAGGTHPWIWDAARGLRFLADLIDPGSGLVLLSAARINERGAILGQAAVIGTGERRPYLMTPSAIFADGFETGDASAWSGAMP